MLALAPYIGYLASVLLMIGLIVKTSLQFRWWNALGCFVFIIYAVIIGAVPVILTNAVLLAINIFFLFKIYGKKEHFDITLVEGNDVLVQKFLAFHAKEIGEYFPNFQLGKMPDNKTFVILRDMAIANIFDAEITKDGAAVVNINYTIPAYRDYKVGRFLFGREKQILKNYGIKTVLYNTPIKKSHEKFLLKSGFTEQKDALGKIFKKEI